MQSPRVEKYTPEEFDGVNSDTSAVQIMQFELFIAAVEVFHEYE